MTENAKITETQAKNTETQAKIVTDNSPSESLNEPRLVSGLTKMPGHEPRIAEWEQTPEGKKFIKDAKPDQKAKAPEATEDEKVAEQAVEDYTKQVSKS